MQLTSRFSLSLNFRQVSLHVVHLAKFRALLGADFEFTNFVMLVMLIRTLATLWGELQLGHTFLPCASLLINVLLVFKEPWSDSMPIYFFVKDKFAKLDIPYYILVLRIEFVGELRIDRSPLSPSNIKLHKYQNECQKCAAKFSTRYGLRIHQLCHACDAHQDASNTMSMRRAAVGTHFLALCVFIDKCFITFQRTREWFHIHADLFLRKR